MMNLPLAVAQRAHAEAMVKALRDPRPPLPDFEAEREALPGRMLTPCARIIRFDHDDVLVVVEPAVLDGDDQTAVAAPIWLGTQSTCRDEASYDAAFDAALAEARRQIKLMGAPLAPGFICAECWLACGTPSP